METHVMLTYEIAQLKRSQQTDATSRVCGDMTFVEEDSTSLFLALFDGAGHGLAAYRIAAKAIDYLESQRAQPLDEIILSLHEYLRGSWGGVVALSVIDKVTGQCQCVGVGNIGIR